LTIAPAIVQRYPGLNDAQRAIVSHIDGPLLVIAGPGSGKTYSIVLRALNLLLLKKAQPAQLVLCTFTEKAAFEMRDRMAAAARTLGYLGDLSELNVSTIHSFCNRVLTQHRHLTELGHGSVGDLFIRKDDEDSLAAFEAELVVIARHGLVPLARAS